MFNNLKKLLGYQEQQKVTAQPQRLQPKPYMTQGGGFSQFNPQTIKQGYAGNLTPRTEDGYDTDIRHLNGPMQAGRMPMDMDTIPGNGQYGYHPAFFQGSNPFQNIPSRNVYNNINPMPVDDMQYGRQIQKSYTSKPKWY